MIGRLSRRRTTVRQAATSMFLSRLRLCRVCEVQSTERTCFCCGEAMT